MRVDIPIPTNPPCHCSTSEDLVSIRHASVVAIWHKIFRHRCQQTVPTSVFAATLGGSTVLMYQMQPLVGVEVMLGNTVGVSTRYMFPQILSTCINSIGR